MSLARRIEELSAEIRRYPTPIARCDLHLPALIEERALLIEALNREDQTRAAFGCTAEGLWAGDGGFVA